MKRFSHFTACVFAGALAFAVAPRADGPNIYAIRGARLVTARHLNSQRTGVESGGWGLGGNGVGKAGAD